MFFHQAIVDDEWRERNRRKAHTAQFILPITDFFGGKLYVSCLDVIKTGRYVLYLDIFSLIRV